MELGVLVSFLEKEKPLSKNSEKEVWTLENNNTNICWLIVTYTLLMYHINNLSWC